MGFYIKGTPGYMMSSVLRFPLFLYGGGYFYPVIVPHTHYFSFMILFVFVEKGNACHSLTSK